MVKGEWIVSGEQIRLAIPIVQPKTQEDLDARKTLMEYIQGAGFQFQGNSNTHHYFIGQDTPGARLVCNSVACKASEVNPKNYSQADKMTLKTGRNVEQGCYGSTAWRY